MPATFVPNGNVSVYAPTQKQNVMPVHNPEWFKAQLINRGVSGGEIVWGDYVQYFHEIPQELMARYLHHRKTMLHKASLAAARTEHEAMQQHSFARS